MSIREKNTRDAITRNVRRAMFEADLTQVALAEQMTITRETLRHRLSGKKPFTTDELAQIAVATGVPFSDLVKVTGDPIAA